MFSRAPRCAPALLALAGSAAILVAAAPEPIDHAVNARIRAEARDRSRIMQTLHVLTDVHGPRLTGSFNHTAAAESAVAEMKKWGFDITQLVLPERPSAAELETYLDGKAADVAGKDRARRCRHAGGGQFLEVAATV
jgi:hypothetical protein